MDDKNEPQTEGVGVRGYELRGSLEGLRVKENRLIVFGERDVEATRVFRNYHLPGQDYVTVKGGEEVTIDRALLDPEEFVVPVKTVEQGGRLIETVRADQMNLAEAWKRYKNEGQPYLYTSLEIMLGDSRYPESCRRYKLLDVNMAAEAGKLLLSVAPNVEYEKGENVGVPSELTYTEEERRNFPPHMAMGERTGVQIAHQGVPDRVTRLIEVPDVMEITLGKENLWIVAVDVEEVAKKTRV